MIDIHSHIMPEIDDGARSVEEAVRMAEIAAADGIEMMVSTPHMFNGLSHNPFPAEIIERVAKLQQAVGDILKIVPGNEAHFSHEIADQAKNHRVTLINNRNYMLVELPDLTVPLAVEDLFYKLQLQGVCPILVHPERNTQIQSRPSIVGELVAKGIFIQITAMSITGEFGSVPKQCAETLLKHNCVHFLATDCHRPERRPPIISKARDAAARIVGDETARKLVYDNPLAVVNGERVAVQPVIPFDPPKKRERSALFSRIFR